MTRPKRQKSTTMQPPASGGMVHGNSWRIPAKGSYLNGNLAIQMVTWESGDPEPWATLTVNLPGQRQKNHAFIDTNADSEFPTWLIRHGLAIPTGRTMQSGFCTYPEYRFRANRLQELNPEGYAGYLKNFERRCSA